MAVRHVALFRFGADVTGGQVQALADALDRLPQAVGVMLDYRHGRDLGISETSYDYGVVGDFATVDDYLTYRDHPDHRAVIEGVVTPIVTERASIQIEVPGPGVSPVAAGEALDEPSPPDRAPALVTVETPDYDFELILEDFQGHTSGSVRRTDDLDNWFDSDGRPDRYGLWQRSDWGVTGGSRCLTSGGGLFAWFSDGAPPHAFTYGAAGRNVARFD